MTVAVSVDAAPPRVAVEVLTDRRVEVTVAQPARIAVDVGNGAGPPGPEGPPGPAGDADELPIDPVLIFENALA